MVRHSGGRAEVKYLMVHSASMSREIPVAFERGGPHAVLLLDAFDAAPDISKWVSARSGQVSTNRAAVRFNTEGSQSRQVAQIIITRRVTALR